MGQEDPKIEIGSIRQLWITTSNWTNYLATELPLGLLDSVEV